MEIPTMEARIMTSFAGAEEMLLRTVSGWFAFFSILAFIKDRRTYMFRNPGAVGVQALAFGMFWYSLVTMFSTTATILATMGQVHWAFVVRFTSNTVWHYLMYGDVVINSAIGSIALSCRLTTNTKRGRRLLKGKLE